MFKTWPKLYFIFLILFFTCDIAFAQKDIDFHLTNTFLPGKNIRKVKRDFNDPYVWVLANDNEVYRINSETLAITDYTAVFSPHSYQPFIDIAGNSKDEVYIALGNKIIKYLNGTITSITNADGLRGNLNAIGFSNYISDTYTDTGIELKGPALMVSSDITVDYYYITSKQFRYPVDFDKARLQVASYKNTMVFRDEEDVTWQFQKGCYPVYSYVSMGLYWGYIYLEPEVFGTQLKATYYANGFDYYSWFNTNFSLWGNQFWATEKGLFQNTFDHSHNPSIYGYHHYLENNHINQITAIYGLSSFGLLVMRENLLVGTDEGLYVSNSKAMPKEKLPDYNFYRYDGLGSKKINYIEVNAKFVGTQKNYYDPGEYCENGVWVGANDGLYLIKPDYSNYFDQNQTFQSITFKNGNIGDTEKQLCTGQTTQAYFYTSANSNIQWYKNGVELPNQSGSELEINSAGDYYAKLYDPCSDLHLQTNTLKVTYLDGVTVPFNYPDKMKFCYGSTATLSVPNNPEYQYRWYKDGVLNGGTTPSIDIFESGKYKLEVNSCAGMWVPTKEVQIDFIQMPKPVITAPKYIICDGDEVTLTSSVPIDASDITNWQPYTYKWYRNGLLLPDVTASIKASIAGEYRVEVTSCAGNSNKSDIFYLKIVELPTPQISTLKDVFCEGETANINTNVLADPNYIINWYKDGVLMPANINKTSIMVTAGGGYNYSIASNVPDASCLKTSPVKSIIFTPGPAFTFNYPALIIKCVGETVNLTINGNPSYKYRWYKNGVLTNETSSTLPVTTTGKYKGEVSVCENSWVPTTEVEVRFTQLPVPVITSNKNGYCIGDNAQLSVNVPSDPSYTINWYRDGNLVSEGQNQTLIPTIAGGNYVVKVISNLTVCEQSSAPKNIVFETKPEVHIEKIVKTTLCEGETIDLKINLTGGTVKWSTGETSPVISVKHSGVYKVDYTSAGGCEVSDELPLNLYPKPVLNLFDQAICAFKKETLNLTAPAGYKSYSWNNGESISSTFAVNKPQTVTLTVTDFNNCTATQSILIRNQCPDIRLANAFTPNGDGVNDTWLITGVEDDPTVVVRVFNRAGNQVFESKGYQNAWDGTYNGKKLSAGVYYYVITTKASSEILKGALTIIY